MSITFGTLKARIATVLNDPNSRTFTDDLLSELVLSGLTEVGRLAPEQFVEDLTPVANQMTYALRDDAFLGEAVPELEVVRVEVWDPTQEPERLVSAVNSAAKQPDQVGDTGWYVWGGQLTLPNRTVSALVGFEATYVIRVWGYSPYVQPTAEDEVIAISKDVEQALVWYAKIEAIDLLLASRDLYTQWQTRSGNTDISPAGLMNQRSIAEQMWRAKSRAITRLRSEV